MLELTKISFWKENRGVGYDFVKLRGLAYISKDSKILSLKLFGN